MGITLKGLFGSRKKRIVVGILVSAVVLFTGVYAYWASRPSTVGPKVTLTSPPFELSMSLDKTEYTLSDNMTITFCLRNTSNKTVTIGKSSMDPGPGEVTTASEGVSIQWASSRDLNIMFHFGYILFDNNGKVIDQHLEGQLQAVYGLVFEPNASLNQTLSINLATYNELYGSPSSTIQKGSYQISGALDAGVTDTEQDTWETPSIAFTVS